MQAPLLGSHGMWQQMNPNKHSRQTNELEKNALQSHSNKAWDDLHSPQPNLVFDTLFITNDVMYRLVIA
jgi:hypothetical protein